MNRSPGIRKGIGTVVSSQWDGSFISPELTYLCQIDTPCPTGQSGRAQPSAGTAPNCRRAGLVYPELRRAPPGAARATHQSAPARYARRVFHARLTRPASQRALVAKKAKRPHKTGRRPRIGRWSGPSQLLGCQVCSPDKRVDPIDGIEPSSLKPIRGDLDAKRIFEKENNLNRINGIQPAAQKQRSVIVERAAIAFSSEQLRYILTNGSFGIHGAPGDWLMKNKWPRNRRCSTSGYWRSVRAKILSRQ